MSVAPHSKSVDHHQSAGRQDPKLFVTQLEHYPIQSERVAIRPTNLDCSTCHVICLSVQNIPTDIMKLCEIDLSRLVFQFMRHSLIELHVSHPLIKAENNITLINYLCI